MIIECSTIVLIIMMIGVVFLRTKRANYAFITFPLVTVPLMHLLGVAIAYFLIEKNDFTVKVATILSFDILGLLVGALLVGILLHNLPTKRSRLSFAMIAAIFMIALSIVLMCSLIV